MKIIGTGFVGDAEHFTFEERIFNFAMLLGICMTAFGTVMDLLYYGVGILIDLAFVGCWILTYYLSRFKGYFNVVSVVSTGVFVFVFIPFSWISSGGSSGILPYYNIVFIAIISIILKGNLRRVMVFSSLAVVLFLVYFDAYKAGTFAVVFRDNLFDFSIHLSVMMVAMVVLIIVYSNTYMKEKARSEAYAKTIEEQYHQQLYYMENLEQLIYKLKSERHDFNNHLGVIYGLMEDGETDKAGNYVAHLVKTAEEYQNIANIPYSLMRAILNYKLSTARESGIELRLNINLTGGLKLNEFDLAVMLGNLLDNAVEACAAIEENNRYIGLNIMFKPDYLIIQMKNPVNRESLIKNGKARTTKPDAENHGFGLSNIEYLVKKHNGLIKIEKENDYFEVDIAILVDSH